MNEQAADRLLRNALDALQLEVGLPSDVNERTITHRLALHLETQVRECGHEELGVRPEQIYADCEYNRAGDDPKRLYEVQNALLGLQTNMSATERDWLEDTRGRTVFPDIIVHQRGTQDANLMVIEVKRVGAAKAAIAYDKRKLRLYSRQLGYQHAFLVLLDARRWRVLRVSEA